MPSERFTFEADERPPFNRVVTTLLSHEQALALKKAAKHKREPVSAFVRNLITDHITALGLYDEDGEYRRHTLKKAENERLGIVD